MKYMIAINNSFLLDILRYFLFPINGLKYSKNIHDIAVVTKYYTYNYMQDKQLNIHSYRKLKDLYTLHVNGLKHSIKPYIKELDRIYKNEFILFILSHNILSLLCSTLTHLCAKELYKDKYLTKLALNKNINNSLYSPILGTYKTFYLAVYSYRKLKDLYTLHVNGLITPLKPRCVGR